MARLYFNLYSEGTILHDPEGTDLSLPAAICRALIEVRALIAADALDGCIDLRQHLDVDDVNGVTLHSLAFIDAVEVVG